MLKSSCIRATLSCNVRCVRRTTQVPHRARRPTSDTQVPQTKSRQVYGRHAYGVSGSADGMVQQQSPELDCRPNISMLAEELQGQWHEQLNRHLGNVFIKPASHRKVWWLCEKCPDSFPHIWEATVKDRTYGRGCPFCSGNAVCQHNTLARKAPEVALFWDAKKNHPMSPDQVTVSSHMRVHWKCSACMHEWQAAVSDKARGKSGCPKCAKANSGRKADGTRQKHPTFARAKHALLEQWDHCRENGNFPDNTSLQSHKLIWWQCHACPKGRVHSWQAPAYSQTRQTKKAAGCPCAGQQLCECNCLENMSLLSDEPPAGAKKRSVTQRTSRTRKKFNTHARRS
ncbi:TPA: hypothetical protein ACH3X3_003841 [Trebouxia sp. C0006]